MVLLAKVMAVTWRLLVQRLQRSSALANTQLQSVNLVTYLQNSDEWVKELQRVEFGDERDPKMREFLIECPAQHVRSSRCRSSSFKGRMTR